MNQTRPGSVAVVADESDSLATIVNTRLEADGHTVHRIFSTNLASTPVALAGKSLLVNGQPVDAVLFRAKPDANFSGDFLDSDASFCSFEARSTWLAALNLSSVYAINRPDEELWFSNSEWPVWRRRLVNAGLPVAPLSVGDPGSASAEETLWMPWVGGFSPPPGRHACRAFGAAIIPKADFSQTLWCCGESIEGPDDNFIRAAAGVLENHGTVLAGIISDHIGRIVSCTAYPEVPDALLSPVAHRVTEALGENLRRR